MLPPACVHQSDLRYALSIDTLDDESIYSLKYDDFSSSAGAQTDPLLVLRHAEQVLIAAEAAAAQGDFDLAEKWLNQVCTRAGLDPIDDLDADNYLDRILAERFVELTQEGGHRLWDMRRTRRAGATSGEEYDEECDDRWPFPQREIDRNPNLVQDGACNG